MFRARAQLPAGDKLDGVAGILWFGKRQLERGYEKEQQRRDGGIRCSQFLVAWEPEGTWHRFAGNARMGSFGQGIVQFWSLLLLGSAEARRKQVQKRLGEGWLEAAGDTGRRSLYSWFASHALPLSVAQQQL